MPLIGLKRLTLYILGVGYCCLQHIYLVHEELGVLWNVWIEAHTGLCIECFDNEKNYINLLNMIFSSIFEKADSKLIGQYFFSWFVSEDL